MAVKLYGPITPSTQRILICLIEKEIEFEVVPLDVDKGDNKVPEYLQSPPFAVVNVIEDGDFTLHEPLAMMKYLADKYKNQGVELLGRTLEERCLVEQWLDFEAQHFQSSFCNLAINTLFSSKLGGPPNHTRLIQDAASLGMVLDRYEERLSEKKYLAGDFFSLADVSHVPFIGYMMNTLGKGRMIRERVNVSSWWDDISSRSSWKKIIQFYGIN